MDEVQALEEKEPLSTPQKDLKSYFFYKILFCDLVTC